METLYAYCLASGLAVVAHPMTAKVTSPYHIQNSVWGEIFSAYQFRGIPGARTLPGSPLWNSERVASRQRFRPTLGLVCMATKPQTVVAEDGRLSAPGVAAAVPQIAIREAGYPRSHCFTAT